MEVYRLALENYATLDGMGGLFGDGRWHKKGYNVTYATSSRSLAVLERLVHSSPTDIPSMVMITIFIPDDIPYKQFTSAELPKNWDTIDSGDLIDTQDIGTHFLQKSQYAFMKVPSAIVPHEYNYIINPKHTDSHRIVINELHPYRFDARYQRFIKA